MSFQKKKCVFFIFYYIYLENISMILAFFTALPDPPMDVRVDGGPQDGTILVTWIPVTICPTSAQRVVPVTGYAVFADGKRVTDVDSPSSDHALVDLGRFLKHNLRVGMRAGQGSGWSK